MTTTTLEQVRNAWPQIESHGAVLSHDYRYLGLDQKVPSGEILVAIDHQGGRHLFVPVPSNMLVVSDTRSRGVHILERELIRDQRRLKYVDVACLVPEVHELFDEVAAGMLDELQPETQSPAVVCRAVLDNWRMLIERAPQQTLSRDALVGLFGELLVLGKLATLNPDVLGIWMGPEPPPGRHDFRRESDALEVKATTTRRGRVCEIHGHRQLEPPSDGKLMLLFVRVEIADAGKSIPSLIDAIVSQGVSRLGLLEKLEKLGYSVNDAPHYQSFRFSVIEERMYNVDAQFPKIVGAAFSVGHLPPGVTYINYGIDLSGEPPFPVTPEAKEDFLRQLAGV